MSCLPADPEPSSHGAAHGAAHDALNRAYHMLHEEQKTHMDLLLQNDKLGQRLDVMYARMRAAEDRAETLERQLAAERQRVGALLAIHRQLCVEAAAEIAEMGGPPDDDASGLDSDLTL